MESSVHTPVLLNEVLDGLAVQPGDVVVDGTVGGAGHSEAILKRYSDQIRLICLDADSGALTRARERLASFDQSKITFVESNFRRLVTVLDELGVPKINRLLLDIGLSSDELENSGRGFSFRKLDEPLLMTFVDPAKEQPLITAEVILNSWSEETLATIIYGYGEERYSKKIAAAIVEQRTEIPFKTVGQLVDVILQATPKSYQHRKIHPATRTFQALRIAVNDELGALREGLEGGWQVLASGGRMAVISFHSLEDRVVKRFFQEEKKAGRAELLTKKPMIASPEEAKENPRARSAKLRIICKK
jgi:16S rRNA (cytosine1402-N4)-methyltransferase